MSVKTYESQKRDSVKFKRTVRQEVERGVCADDCIFEFPEWNRLHTC
jgi:hypothetical protein